jgi:hypothetical protein
MCSGEIVAYARPPEEELIAKFHYSRLNLYIPTTALIKGVFCISLI